MKEANCKIVLDKGTKIVKCNTYKHSGLGRTIAVHEDPSNKGRTNLTDFVTGYKFLTIAEPMKNVREQLVQEKLEGFLKHFGVKETLDRLTRLESEKEK